MLDNSKFDADVFIDFPYEQVMFHWRKSSGVVWRKFYGSTVASLVGIQSSMFRDAQRHGNEITKAQYNAGKGV